MKKIHMYGALGLLCLAGAVLLAIGCGEDDSPTGGGGDAADVNAYLSALPSWETFANVQDSSLEVAGAMTAQMSDNVLCTTVPYSITDNPEEIVTFGSAPDVMYLGSLIQGDSYLGGLMTMEELPIRQRAPLTIALKLFSGTEITTTVNDPDAASVQAALNTLVSQASQGHQLGSNIYYRKVEAYSAQQAALGLDVSFKYMGSKGHAALDYASSSQTHSVAALFKQVMFTAYIVRPQTPADFFSSEFSRQKLDEQIAMGNIGDDNLPVYVARIQYGRMLMYTMTHTATAERLRTAVEASYKGVASVDASIQAEIQSILNNATVEFATIGGSASNAINAIRTGTLEAYFEAADDSITTAEPLAYALCNLADGSLAQVSEMTEYEVEECNSPHAEVYLNETEWQMAVDDMVGPGHRVTFLTTAENVSLANETGYVPGSNRDLGWILTFDSSKTHYPFIFELKATQGGSQFTYDDYESGPAFGAYQERSLSVGDVNDHEDDNFIIDIPNWHPNAAVFAIGITIGDNNYYVHEAPAVAAVDGFSASFPGSAPHCPNTCGFVGVVATVPLTQFSFNESTDGDDIFIRDPSFGVIEWRE